MVDMRWVVAGGLLVWYFVAYHGVLVHVLKLMPQITFKVLVHQTDQTKIKETVRNLWQHLGSTPRPRGGVAAYHRTADVLERQRSRRRLTSTGAPLALLGACGRFVSHSSSGYTRVRRPPRLHRSVERRRRATILRNVLWQHWGPRPVDGPRRSPSVPGDDRLGAAQVRCA